MSTEVNTGYDLSEEKAAIANAYEGRAVRDAIVAMVQAVEDSLNSMNERLSQTSLKATQIERSIWDTGGISDHVDNLETRVTALEGGSTNENDT